MLTKIKNLPYQHYAKQLRDPRMLGLVGFGIITLLVSWSGLNVIQTNYDLQKQQAQLEEQNKVLQLQNQNQELRNRYFTTDQYLELTARKLYNRAAPGEQLIIVPKSVALAHSTEPPATNTSSQANRPQKPRYQRNFEAWMSFIFHRSTPDSD